jgi:hypothetical protein
MTELYVVFLDDTLEYQILNNWAAMAPKDYGILIYLHTFLCIRTFIVLPHDTLN